MAGVRCTQPLYYGIPSREAVRQIARVEFVFELARNMSCECALPPFAAGWRIEVQKEPRQRNEHTSNFHPGICICCPQGLVDWTPAALVDANHSAKPCTKSIANRILLRPLCKCLASKCERLSGKCTTEKMRFQLTTLSDDALLNSHGIPVRSPPWDPLRRCTLCSVSR